MALDVKIQGLDGLMDRLRRFPKEMAVRGGPIRSALFQGAKIVREQAKTNVQQIIDEPNKSGADESTGTLKKAIVMRRDRDPKRFGGASEVYHVTVNRSKSPKGVPAGLYGNVLEFGSESIKAYAWLRRAAAEKQAAVFAAIALHLRKGIERVERKLGVLKK